MPTKIGKIYDFATGKVLVYNVFQTTCQEYRMEDVNTAPFLKSTG